jgi:hypothetical protein
VTLAAEPVTFAATMLLILKTNPDDAALDNNTLAVVLAGVKKVVVPRMVVTLTMFGFAMIAP